VAAVIAVVVVAVPVAIGLGITSGGSGPAAVSEASSNFKPVGSGSGSAGTQAGQSGTQGGSGQTGAQGSGGSSGSQAGSASGGGSGSTSGSSTGSGTSTTASTATVVPPPSSSRSLVGLLLHKTIMRKSPGGHALAKIPTRTVFGSPTTFLVVRARGEWLGVISPNAGNGHVGWIKRSTVSLNVVHWKLEVNLAARKLTVKENGRTLQRYSVAIGRPDAPTPAGHFAVTDRLATHDPSGPYGCCILALSAESPHAIQGWSGGNRIAIHSTPDSGSIGQAVSHGCVRVTLGDGNWLLKHIPLGTPTIIRT
jgi:hypothetical protein